MGKEDKPEWKEERFWDGFWEYRRQQKELEKLWENITIKHGITPRKLEDILEEINGKTNN